MGKWTIAVAAAIAVAAPVVAAANSTGTVVGRVTDAVTGEPIRRAVVKVENPRLYPTEQRVRTDSDGNYELAFLPDGHYTLTVTAPGHEEVETNHLAIHTDRTLRDNAAMPELKVAS